MLLPCLMPYEYVCLEGACWVSPSELAPRHLDILCNMQSMPSLTANPCRNLGQTESLWGSSSSLHHILDGVPCDAGVSCRVLDNGEPFACTAWEYRNGRSIWQAFFRPLPGHPPGWTPWLVWATAGQSLHVLRLCVVLQAC